MVIALFVLNVATVATFCVLNIARVATLKLYDKKGDAAVPNQKEQNGKKCMYLAQTCTPFYQFAHDECCKYGLSMRQLGV